MAFGFQSWGAGVALGCAMGRPTSLTKPRTIRAPNASERPAQRPAAPAAVTARKPLRVTVLFFCFDILFSTGETEAECAPQSGPTQTAGAGFLRSIRRPETPPVFMGLLPRSHISLSEKGGRKNQCRSPFQLTFGRRLCVRVWTTGRSGKVAARRPLFAACARLVRSTP